MRRASSASKPPMRRHSSQVLRSLPPGCRLSAVAIGKAIAIRRAVRMGCADQNILRGDFLDAGAHLVAERCGKTKEIRAHNGDASFVLFEDERTHIQLALFARYLMGRSDSAADRQQWVRRDNAHG